MSDASERPTAKRSWFRFSLLTLLMLITVAVVLVEKPVRKMQGKRKLAAATIKGISPTQLDWNKDLGPWYVDWLPRAWIQEKDYEGIEVVRLTHNYAMPAGEVPEHMKRSLGWAENDRNLMKLLLKYPEATEDVWAIELGHPMTEEFEDWIVSRPKLRVLEVRSGKPFRDKFFVGLAKLRNLEVLILTNVTAEQVEILKTMKQLKRLQILVRQSELIASLRDALPNTYVD